MAGLPGLKSILIALVAAALSRPVFRLCLGRWPDRGETALFVAGLRDQTSAAPFLFRGLLALPAFRRLVSHALLTQMAEERAITSHNVLDRFGLNAAGTIVPPHSGDPLTFWRGPDIAFLHLEKTAGSSLSKLLTDRFHPHQIDQDPRRTAAPHVVPPFADRAPTEVRRSALILGHYDLPSLRRLDPTRKIVTMFREPAARIISIYYYWRSIRPELIGQTVANEAVLYAQNHSLLDFLDVADPLVTNYLDNFYVRRLTGSYARHDGSDPLAAAPERCLAQALDGLRTIEFVGITERMETSVSALADFLGFAPPTSSVRENATAEADGSGVFRATAREALTARHQERLAELTRLDSIVYDAALARLGVVGHAANAPFDEARPGALPLDPTKA